MRCPHARATTIDLTPEGVGKIKSDDMRVRADGWRVRHRSRNTTTNRKKKTDGTGFEHLSKTVSPPSLQISTALSSSGPGVSGAVVRVQQSMRTRK